MSHGIRFVIIAVLFGASNGCQQFAAAPVGSSTTESSVSLPPGSSTPAPGLTPVTADFKTYYVSPAGHDENDGLSPAKPWATIQKVNAAKFAAGDHLLFEGGQTFRGCLNFTPSMILNSTASRGLTVGAYGAGSFTLQADCTGFNATTGAGAAAVMIYAVNGFRISNAILRGAVGQADGTPYGIAIQNNNYAATTMTNISITNCDIGGFYTNNPKKFGAGIWFNTYYKPIDSVYIGSNKIHGLTGPTSPDDNGIMGATNQKNLSHITYEKNVIYDIGGKPNGPAGCEGNAIVAIGVNGGTMQLNVAHDLAANVNTCGGGGGFWAANANDVTIQSNEAYHVQPLGAAVTNQAGCDWDGFDLDYSVTNSVVQYNYSHDNFGIGYLLFGGGVWGPNVLRYNVSVNDGRNPGVRAVNTGGITVGGASVPMPMSIYNNTVLQTAGTNSAGTNPSFVVASATVTPSGLVANNIFYNNASYLDSQGLKSTNIVSNVQSTKTTNLVSRNNTYFSSLYSADQLANHLYFSFQPRISLTTYLSRNLEPSAKFADPLFSAPVTSAPICFATYAPQSPAQFSNCLSGRLPTLTATSPDRSAGLDLTQAPYGFQLGGTSTGYSGSTVYGAHDFFGNPVPSQTSGAFNIGADGN